MPGIEEIPDTVLEPGSSKVDKNPRRKKPWEKDTPAVEAETETTGQEQGQPEAESQAASAGEEAPTAQEDINVNGHKETGQGVVNILKPNAVPDSGLLSKD